MLEASIEEQGEDGFNSSDDEKEEHDTTPFSITWLDLSDYGFEEPLGLSGLPGCCFKDTWRCLDTDIKTLKKEEVDEVFVLCTRGELNKFRVPNLFEGYTDAGIGIHHYPIQDGNVPTMPTCVKMLDEIKVNLSKRVKTVIHCFGGFGRTCLVATCLLLILDESLTSESVIEKMRTLRGPRAIQTVRQFNFVNDFRKFRDEYEAECDKEGRRSVSR